VARLEDCWIRDLVFDSVALSCWMSRSSLRTFWRTRALHLRFLGERVSIGGVDGKGRELVRTCSSGVGFQRRPRMVSMVGAWFGCARVGLEGACIRRVVVVVREWVSVEGYGEVAVVVLGVWREQRGIRVAEVRGQVS